MYLLFHPDGIRSAAMLRDLLYAVLFVCFVSRIRPNQSECSGNYCADVQCIDEEELREKCIEGVVKTNNTYCGCCSSCVFEIRESFGDAYLKWDQHRLGGRDFCSPQLCVRWGEWTLMSRFLHRRRRILCAHGTREFSGGCGMCRWIALQKLHLRHGWIKSQQDQYSVFFRVTVALLPGIRRSHGNANEQRRTRNCVWMWFLAGWKNRRESVLFLPLKALVAEQLRIVSALNSCRTRCRWISMPLSDSRRSWRIFGLKSRDVFSVIRKELYARNCQNRFFADNLNSKPMTRKVSGDVLEDILISHLMGKMPALWYLPAPKFGT